MTVARLQSQSGKDIWLFGGGSLFRSLAEAKLVDTVEVAVAPILLGGGVPLLPPPAHRIPLAFKTQQVYPSGIVSLEYTITGFLRRSSSERSSPGNHHSHSAGRFGFPANGNKASNCETVTRSEDSSKVDNSPCRNQRAPAVSVVSCCSSPPSLSH
jgi:RibD C-terminal domain